MEACRKRIKEERAMVGKRSTGARTARLALVAAASATVLAACGGGGSDSSSSSAATPAKGGGAAKTANDAPFNILWIGAFTGDQKLYGAGQYQGGQAAAAYINAHGGMAGHPVKLIKVDDGTDPTTAVQDLLKYTSSNAAPDAVWAGTESDDTQALFPTLQRKGLIGYAATDGPNMLQAGAHAKYPNQFSAADNKSVADGLAAQWFKSHGAHKVGILEEAVSYATSETPLIESALKSQGLDSTVASVSATATDVTPEISKLKAAGADAIFAEVVGPPAGYVLKARAKNGWNAPVLGDLAFAAIDVTTLAPKEDLKNVYTLAQHSMPVNASYQGLNLFKQYYKQLGFTPGADGLSTEAAGWDGTMALYTAAKQANSVDKDKLSAALESLQAAPYYVDDKNESFTTDTHENASASPADFVVIPVGPWVAGQVK
jgi:branched-chain amino acid transport system substrate-binding protein